MSDLARRVEKLAPCPFCGDEPVSMDGVTRLWACIKHTFWMERDKWNRRALLSAGPDREAIVQILVEEYPACIKRPSDAYRVADRILTDLVEVAEKARAALREGAKEGTT